MANEKMAVIKKTTDYDLFQLIRGNRDINKNRVAALRKSISKNNLLYLVPIVANERYEIIDGQHRWAAARSLEVPIYYIMAEGISVEDMIALNAYQKNWHIDDYLNLYIKSGKKEYKELKEFRDKYHLTTAVAMGVLSMHFTHSSTLREDFKQGEFVISNREEAEKLMEEINILRPYFDEFVYTNPRFLHAYVEMRKQIALEELESQLKTHNLKIERRQTRRDYLRHFEDILNFRKQKNIARLY